MHKNKKNLSLLNKQNVQKTLQNGCQTDILHEKIPTCKKPSFFGNKFSTYLELQIDLEIYSNASRGVKAISDDAEND